MGLKNSGQIESAKIVEMNETPSIEYEGSKERYSLINFRHGIFFRFGNNGLVKKILVPPNLLEKFDFILELAKKE